MGREGWKVMQMIRRRDEWKLIFAFVSIWTLLLLSACGSQGDGEQSADREGSSAEDQMAITVMLDWVPNTNHTGLYVAQDQGYFADEGLNVEISTPAEMTAIQIVGTEKAEFGISSQEYVTQARAEGVPVVSIASILYENTSGFAAPQEKNISSPKDFVDKTYGGWGAPIENAFLETVLKMDGVEFDHVEDVIDIINVGEADFFTNTQREIDFQWIYYGWTGIEAELRDYPINMISLKDLDPVLDFHTPTIVTSETMIREYPETVEKFMRAVSKGYEFAIEHPDEAANILIAATPEADAELIRASQQWMSERYQGDASQWGIQDEQTWLDFTEWMVEHELIDEPIDATKAFTNEYLPES